MFGMELAPKFFAAVQSAEKELIYAGLKTTSFVALAAHTYGKGTDPILPFMFSGIAVGGIYDFFKIMRRNSGSEMQRNWSWDFASGIFTYATGVYAFSEFFKCNDMKWIPCFALAASGYSLTISSIDSLGTILRKRPWLKCCQLISEPALVACAATYLFYFQNHTEKWLRCLPLLVTANTGFKLAHRSSLGCMSAYNSELVLPEAIEMLMGGSFLWISCTALAIYSLENGFYWPWTAAMSYLSLYGLFFTFASLVCFQGCIEMRAAVFYRLCGMAGGPIVSLVACFGVKCFGHPLVRRVCLVTAGVGHLFFGISFISLYCVVPEAVFKIYYKRVMGPMLIVYISTFAAFFGREMGRQISLVTIPCIAAGIYATYDGFRRPIESSE